MIEVRDLTKRFGDKVAVDHLSFTVEPGRVTGFLGPNGAGKSTTMRLILGLDYPNTGTATINGELYRDLPSPLETPWFRWIREGLPTGRTEAVLSQLGSTILSVMQIVGLERLDRIDATFLRAYAAPFPTPADCKGAIERSPQGEG